MMRLTIAMMTGFLFVSGPIPEMLADDVARAILIDVAGDFDEIYADLNTWTGRATSVKFARDGTPQRLMIQTLKEEDRPAVEAMFEEGSLVRGQTAEVSFWANLDEDRIRSSFRQVPEVTFESVLQKTRLKLVPEWTFWREGILTSDDFYSVYQQDRCGPFHELYDNLKTSEGGNRIVVRDIPAEGRRNRYADVFDPRRLWECFGWTMGEMVRHTLKLADEGTTTLMAVNPSVDGASVAVRWNLASVEHIVNVGEIAGRSVILHAEMRSQKGARFPDSWEYQELNGYVVPRRFVSEHWDDAGELVRRHTITVDAQVINEKVDDDLFLPEHLTVDNGDRLIDRQNKTVQIFFDSELISISEFEELLRAGEHVRSRRSEWFLFALLTLAGLVLIGLGYFSRTRRRAAPA